MNSYVTDTQALIKFMQNKKVINDKYQEIFEEQTSVKTLSLFRQS